MRPCSAGRRAFDNADVLYTALADVRLAGSGVPSTGSAGGRLLRYSLPSQRVGRPVKGRALNSEQATEGDIFRPLQQRAIHISGSSQCCMRSVSLALLTSFFPIAPALLAPNHSKVGILKNHSKYISSQL